jgi:hypothetical protein
VIRRRVIVHQRDVDTGSSQVIADDAHVVSDAEAIGLPRLGGRVRDVDDEALRVGDRARDLRHEKARADRREEASGTEGDEIGGGDRLDAPVGRADVVILEIDALDSRLAGRAHVDLFLHDTAVRELRAKMRVVEGHRQDPAPDLEKSRGLLHCTKERSLLLRQRRKKEVAEGHPVQLLALVGLEPMREEANQRGVALGEHGQRAPDVPGRGHVQCDAHFARRAARVRHRDEAGDVLGVTAEPGHDRRRSEPAADTDDLQPLHGLNGRRCVLALGLGLPAPGDVI